MNSHLPPETHIDMKNVATIILGGGQGLRLDPLTITRCKPAVPFAGKYRLIDIPMSNALNSDCKSIFILTQFLSGSLNQHIFNTYRFGTIFPGFVEVLPAEQGPTNKTWFQGTADAVRKNFPRFRELPADYFLIISGDQIYNFNFKRLKEHALETDADMVVAAMPVNAEDAHRMGILKINEENAILDFCEKPQTLDLLNKFEIPKSLKVNLKDEERKYLGSMGIYLFKRQALFDLLNDDVREDFGKHLIPTQVAQGKAFTYLFNGYWEDIGTVHSFFKANLALTQETPKFNLYDDATPVFAQPSHLPGAKIVNTHVDRSIFCEGSIVHAQEVHNSIIGPRSVIGKGCLIKDSYLMGNDFYFPPLQVKHLHSKLEIEEDSIIEKAIIDKHVHIGKGVQLVNKDKLVHYSSDTVCIRDGIIIVRNGATIPDGFIL